MKASSLLRDILLKGKTVARGEHTDHCLLMKSLCFSAHVLTAQDSFGFQQDALFFASPSAIITLFSFTSENKAAEL
jgi:hypothetical protein